MNKEILMNGFKNLYQAKVMSELYEDNFKLVSKYVHATSRGHEAIQTAVGMQLKNYDYAYPYYRDDAMIMAIGMQPKDMMLQLMAKKDDPFSGGRTYYSHPSLKDDDKCKIPHQSSATGMQVIPATGAALGLKYKELQNLNNKNVNPLVLCSIGDAAMTEGEVSEALQMAALKQLPIIYLVQDNGWDISANAEETRAQDAYDFVNGYHGIEAIRVDGSDFMQSYKAVQEVIKKVRKERRPFLIHAKCPLLNHHTSGVRMEFYRDDLEEAKKTDPYPKFRKQLLDYFDDHEIEQVESEIHQLVHDHFEQAKNAEDPQPEDLYTNDFAPTAITDEIGDRSPLSAEEVVMVDCALFAIEELMSDHKECLLYGQDVGRRLGGVFREAATLAGKFGDDRVFNTPIQEAFIVGSTVGMAAVGLKPIVEVQFADYIWPGLNQLFTEVSRSYYLSNGKWPVPMILRVPLGAYGSGGPYHSSSVESIVTNIRGLKIAYPSNGADLKGLLKSAYYDPNPVVVFEHKGLYWSKVKGTKAATTKQPSQNYRLPFGKANIINEIWPNETEETLSVITYGMGVHWALNAVQELNLLDKIEILDLRSLYPLDEEAIYKSVKKCKKSLIVTEEPSENSFARSLSSKVQENCFEYLDSPVKTIGSENMPAIPLNSILEQAMIPSVEKLKDMITKLIDY